ncbi:MAG TPA: hypothetical protein VMV73_03655, partial [Candidatus Dormibacteraeota bacterium]|nr:hypothetical protein [Candidatus Dormibacteraeota bacterium]
ISSTSSQRGEIVPARLAYSLVVGGITVARAGAPEQIEILNVRRASGGDIYGYVDIFFKPFQLSNGLHLPLIAPVQRLSVKSTLGHESTVGVEDTVSNILFPPHVLYEAFRKGRNIVLGTGTQLRARMTARLAVIGGAVVLVTPPPLPIAPDTPSAAFTPIPFITPPPAAMKHGAILHPSPPSTSMPTMSALH